MYIVAQNKGCPNLFLQKLPVTHGHKVTFKKSALFSQLCCQSLAKRPYLIAS